MTRYLISYRSDGERSAVIEAESFAEAEERLEDLAATGRVIGELIVEGEMHGATCAQVGRA